MERTCGWNKHLLFIEISTNTLNWLNQYTRIILGMTNATKVGMLKVGVNEPDLQDVCMSSLAWSGYLQSASKKKVVCDRQTAQKGV